VHDTTGNENRKRRWTSLPESGLARGVLYIVRLLDRVPATSSRAPTWLWMDALPDVGQEHSRKRKLDAAVYRKLRPLT
jgi:hypothetical protein